MKLLSKKLLQTSLLTTLMITSFNAYSCTTVFANNKGSNKVVARTVDLYVSDTPMLVSNPRGTKHSGDAGKNSLSWQSKYGNLVVTAFHTHTASDGINEKGLAAHLLYLSGTEYPTVDNSKPQISNGLWAQYVLDNYATVDEALKGMKDLQVVATKINDKTWPLHLALEDRSGDSAIIEFIKGKMKIYHGSQYQIMTNEPAYDIQLSNLKRYQGFGGKLSLPGDPDPLSRFVRASAYLKTLPSANKEMDAIANVLSVIRTAMTAFGAVDTSGNKTEDAWATRWVSVADVTNNIYYFNSTSAPNIIWVDLNKMDFKEGAAVLSIDPTNIHLEGEITNKLAPQ
ncbi:MAG: linear amide C-N hydrolase [Gammaproteobacteria bacterium]|nr:linear amide C-N hydrolase [Gammaproteobacteria bacterium]